MYDTGQSPGLDLTYHVHQFIFNFLNTFFVCSVWQTKLVIRQLFKRLTLR